MPAHARSRSIRVFVLLRDMKRPGAGGLGGEAASGASLRPPPVPAALPSGGGISREQEPPGLRGTPGLESPGRPAHRAPGHASLQSHRAVVRSRGACPLQTASTPLVPPQGAPLLRRVARHAALQLPALSDFGVPDQDAGASKPPCSCCPIHCARSWLDRLKNCETRTKTSLPTALRRPLDRMAPPRRRAPRVSAGAHLRGLPCPAAGTSGAAHQRGGSSLR